MRRIPIRAGKVAGRRWGYRGVLALAGLSLAAFALSGPRSALAQGSSTCSDAAKAHWQSELAGVLNGAHAAAGYTGVALFNPCGPIDVYGAPAGPALRLAVSHAAPALDLRFHDVPNSAATLQQVQDSITRAYSGLKSQGIKIYEYGPDMTTGRIRIEVDSGTAPQLALLSALFGSSYVDPVAVTDPPHLRAYGDPGNDTPPPYNAGDFIASADASPGNVELCTGGPVGHQRVSLTVTNYYMVTAAHCSQSNNQPLNGTNWINAYSPDGSTVAGSLLDIGTLTANAASGNLDAALIEVPAMTSNQAYAFGWWSSDTLGTQLAYQASTVGTSVCADGAYDGWQCRSGVTQVNLCKSIPGIPMDPVCHLNEVGGVAPPMAGPGDSGGPVMIFLPGPNVTETGIITAGSFGQACPHFQWRGPACGNTLDFTDLGPVLSFFGVSLNM